MSGHRVYEILQRMQLEIEALAELSAGNPNASRYFGEQRQKIRDLLREVGNALEVLPNPYLETSLRSMATKEQGRR